MDLPDAFGPGSVTEIKRFQKNTPIVVLTGYANEITLKESARLGASDIILKSDLMNDIFEQKIRKHL